MPHNVTAAGALLVNTQASVSKVRDGRSYRYRPMVTRQGLVCCDETSVSSTVCVNLSLSLHCLVGVISEWGATSPCSEVSACVRFRYLRSERWHDRSTAHRLLILA